MEALLAEQGLILTSAFFGGIILIAAWEELYPRRNFTSPPGRRWLTNLGINFLGFILIRALFPLAPVLVAVFASEKGLGFFNVLSVPVFVAAIISFILMDLSKYLQHYLLHRVPLLWRFHSVHHSDPEYDFSTGLRFHPLESCFNHAFEAVVLIILGAPAIAVLGYKIVQAFMSAFGHGNIRLPDRVDRTARRVIVTPDVHRIHHSALSRETNSNFGGVSPCWDRLFGTYIDQPEQGHQKMAVGLADQRGDDVLKISRMLLQPFSSSRRETALNTNSLGA